MAFESFSTVQNTVIVENDTLTAFKVKPGDVARVVDHDNHLPKRRIGRFNQLCRQIYGSGIAAVVAKSG